MKLTPYEIKVLKDEVQQRFGKELISSYECVQLSEHIHKTTGKYISSQTIRRFFGFINDGTNPSSYTIAILLNYCNIDSVEELRLQESRYRTKQNLPDAISLIKEFYNISLTPETDFNFQKSCGNVARQILSNPVLMNELSGYLCKNPVSQIYFFERHPYIDGLASGYTKHIKSYITEKNTIEARLFGNCLIHFGLFLSRKHMEASKILEKINAIGIQHTIHPFVQARLIMANLLDAKTTNNTDKLSHWTEIAFREEKRQKRYPVEEAYFPFFQFILADAFNLVGKFDEVLEMIHIASTDYKKVDNSPIEDGYYTALSLMHAIALFHSGNIPACKKLLEKVDHLELIFTSKKYFLIQRLLLELHMAKPQSSKKRQSLHKELNKIVKETGFTYFSA